MVEQRLFESVGLLRLTDGGKSRLFRVPKASSEEEFVISPIPYLSEPQSLLEVYPEAGLIVTQDLLMTIDGRIILEHERAKISIELVSDRWMIVEDMQIDNDERYRITLWDGKEESGYLRGKYMLRTEKYLAVYTKQDRLWRVFMYDGRQELEVQGLDKDVEINGDFLLVKGIGSYTAYTLSETEVNDKPEQRCIFSHKPLVLCSSYVNFALCSDMQGNVQTYYYGEYKNFSRVEEINLYDHANIFSIKRGGRYFLYKLNGEPFAENICPYGADMIAYNQDEKTLLIDTSGVFHMVRA